MHGLLRQEGLLRFYELGGRATGAVGTVPHAPTFDWLPEWTARHTIGDDVRMPLDVQGIRCAACVWVLQTLWQRVGGGRDGGAIDLVASIGRVTLRCRRGSEAPARFVELAARLGYPMAPPSRRTRTDSGLLIRLGICAAVAMNAMILAVSLYFGLDGSIADVSLRTLFGNVLFGLGTVGVVVGGPVFFRTALAGMRAGVVHLDVPISLGLLLAYAGSVHGHFTGGATYFDTVAIFVAFMLGGRFLQQRALAAGRDQVLADDGAEHLRTRRIVDGVTSLVGVGELRAGDRVLLAPGDLLPVRAFVRDPSGGTFSLDWINGESEPRAFAVGDEVPAGAFHAGRRATVVEASGGYAESGLAELFAADPVDREDTRGRVRFWHRLNRWYAAAVLAAAAVGGLVWSAIDPAKALPVAISVLVITCPCAMGIATPLAFHLALANLRRRGVFVRTKSLLDKVRFVRRVVFDKTGTVTMGALRATAIVPPAADVLPVLATMVASSNHPVSQAILQALPERPFDATLEVEEIPGLGLRTTVAGSTFVLAAGGGAGRSSVLTRDGIEVARFELGEDFRRGAADEVSRLTARGLEVHLLSGDRDERVQQAARELGIPAERAHGGLVPAQKAEHIRALDHDDTMMVGDGLNDAPAFAASFCAGTPAMDRPVLPARADFCFRAATAGAVDAVFEVAERHFAVVRTNLVLSLLYNATALGLCFAARMTPLLCAVLMPISSAALVLHTSLRMQPRRASPAGRNA